MAGCSVALKADLTADNWAAEMAASWAVHLEPLSADGWVA